MLGTGTGMRRMGCVTGVGLVEEKGQWPGVCMKEKEEGLWPGFGLVEDQEERLWPDVGLVEDQKEGLWPGLALHSSKRGCDWVLSW